MGFDIGKVLGSIHLPKIDFGSIGKAVLDEGKKILGDVVKDEFTLSNQPGKVLSEDLNLNILGDNIRLPNPVNALANKLLGKADDFLGKFGVNLDFKKMAETFFHLPTEKGGDVTVPPLAKRLATSPGAKATGGGAVQSSVTASAATGVASNAGAAATGGASAPAAAAPSWTGSISGSNDISGIFNSLSGAEATMNKDLTSLANLDPKSPTFQTDMIRLQTEMQNIQRLFDSMSNALKMKHDTASTIIQNSR